MTIKIQTHGGRCCGIKSIHGFRGNRPEDPVLAKKAMPDNHWSTDLYGHSVGQNYNWYRPKRPKETYLERFEEYIRYIQEHRPGGLIEVTMTGGQLRSYGGGWRPHLERLGFKLVSEFYNSNSSDTVYVYHLVYNYKTDDCDYDYDYDDYYGYDYDDDYNDYEEGED